MSALVQPLCASIFTGAFLAAIGTIAATVVPQYRRIAGILAAAVQ